MIYKIQNTDVEVRTVKVDSEHIEVQVWGIDGVFIGAGGCLNGTPLDTMVDRIVRQYLGLPGAANGLSEPQ